jgi:hypothetical protein
VKKSSTTKRKPAKGTGASAKGARKGRAHVEPKAAPPAPAEATPPPPTRVASAATLAEMEESLIPGDPVDGYRLARAIRYAAKVTPKEDGLVVFTHLEGPAPARVGARPATRAHRVLRREERVSPARRGPAR